MFWNIIKESIIDNLDVICTLLWESSILVASLVKSNKLDYSEKQILGVIRNVLIKSKKLFVKRIYGVLIKNISITYDYFNRKLLRLEKKGFLRIINNFKKAVISPEEKFYKYFNII